MAILTEEEILERKAALVASVEARQSVAEGAAVERTAGYKYVRPLSAAADAALEAIENNDERFMLGLAPLDMRTRGFGAKELVFVIGFSHSGKTQLVNTMILNNRAKRVLFFSMDDPAEMILVKLVCMLHDIDAESLERRIQGHDAEARRWVRDAAVHEFRHLSVVDDSLSLANMDKAIDEYTHLHGEPPQAVIIDYLSSMQAQQGEGEDDGIKRKAAALKRWCKDKPFPTIVIHQNSRSNGAPGEPITLLSMGYGGEDVATFVIGVRRKKDWKDLDEHVRASHHSTCTLHLVKNKRPPGKLTAPDGLDFEMNSRTGLIRVQREGLETAEQALAARRS